MEDPIYIQLPPVKKERKPRKKKVSFSPFIIIEHKPITLSFN